MLVAGAMTPHPITVSPTTSITDAAKAMRDNDLGDVLVTDCSGQLCGVVTDRDITLRLALAAEHRRPTASVRDVCSSEPCTVGVLDRLEDAVAIMRRHALRRLPVVDDIGTPVGVISLGDAAHALDPHPPPRNAGRSAAIPRRRG